MNRLRKINVLMGAVCAAFPLVVALPSHGAEPVSADGPAASVASFRRAAPAALTCTATVTVTGTAIKNVDGAGSATFTGTLTNCVASGITPAPPGGTFTGSATWQGMCNAFSASMTGTITWLGIGFGTSQVTGANGTGTVTTGAGLSGLATGGPFGSGRFSVADAIVNNNPLDAETRCANGTGLTAGIGTRQVVFTAL